LYQRLKLRRGLDRAQPNPYIHCMSISALSTRAPAVAGLFYPGVAASLSHSIRRMLEDANPASDTAPKALIAPHAGYIYSGPIAASAYALLAPARDIIERVVLLGPTHRVAVRGLALPCVSHFTTPLGPVSVDTSARETLRHLPQVVLDDAAHAQEHSLEVHLPFLQTILTNFELVPLAVGHADAAEVAAVLDTLWGGPETLIVVSSDLSHYHSYQEAMTMDSATADAILELRTDIDHEQACGATPVCGLALIARRRHLRPRLLDLRSSGDTAGDKTRVVGYGAFAFYEA